MIKEFIVGSPLFGLVNFVRDWISINKAFFRDPASGVEQMEARCGMILLAAIGKEAFVDVGAHIGSVIAGVRRIRPDAPIVAIEADPDKSRRLVARFPDIKVYNVAVGDRSGTVEFFIDLGRPGYSSIGERGRAVDQTRAVTLPMRTLDDILAGCAGVDVIKIDVEGAEPLVLAGANGTMRRNQPLFYFESAQNPGDRPADIFDILDAGGYQIFVPSRLAHDGPPLSRAGFLEAHAAPRRALNFFAVHSDRSIEFRDRARVILGIVTDAGSNNLP
jgi:FkbM family methyltransferase